MTSQYDDVGMRCERDAFDTLFDCAPDKLIVVKKVCNNNKMLHILLAFFYYYHITMHMEFTISCFSFYLCVVIDHIRQQALEQTEL